jgi:hypothetical protein
MSYGGSIRAAIKDPLTDADVAEIEDTMRQVIFHSTLDWQTSRQFNKGARDAWTTIKWSRTPEGKAYVANLQERMIS